MEHTVYTSNDSFVAVEETYIHVEASESILRVATDDAASRRRTRSRSSDMTRQLTRPQVSTARRPLGDKSWSINLRALPKSRSEMPRGLRHKNRIATHEHRSRSQDVGLNHAPRSRIYSISIQSPQASMPLPTLPLLHFSPTIELPSFSSSSPASPIVAESGATELSIAMPGSDAVAATDKALSLSTLSESTKAALPHSSFVSTSTVITEHRDSVILKPTFKPIIGPDVEILARDALSVNIAAPAEESFSLATPSPCSECFPRQSGSPIKASFICPISYERLAPFLNTPSSTRPNSPAFSRPGTPALTHPIAPVFTRPNTPLFSDVPAYTHPNSPYVPWTLPFRRNILRPYCPDMFTDDTLRPCSLDRRRSITPMSRSMTPMSSRPFTPMDRPFSPASCGSNDWSRACPSRSGARAPEPLEPYSEEDVSCARRARLSKLKCLHAIVAKVKHMAKRVMRLKRPGGNAGVVSKRHENAANARKHAVLTKLPSGAYGQRVSAQRSDAYVRNMDTSMRRSSILGRSLELARQSFDVARHGHLLLPAGTPASGSNYLSLPSPALYPKGGTDDDADYNDRESRVQHYSVERMQSVENVDKTLVADESPPPPVSENASPPETLSDTERISERLCISEGAMVAAELPPPSFDLRLSAPQPQVVKMQSPLIQLREMTSTSAIEVEMELLLGESSGLSVLLCDSPDLNTPTKSLRRKRSMPILGASPRLGSSNTPWASLRSTETLWNDFSRIGYDNVDGGTELQLAALRSRL
ncbi:hypothetical protein FISHEDRAFT_76565 [Fistulina hepatica ATCC 64428]|uniref:Uncharacterized protein n=1 Tax=Fistulina hepatica ATCC 64428 TaxID=1128425 RepID=A0A0D7A3U0_9AGAR|nr:hypothetical protein FISHEDRAFT_76565 [Fistulina hepatica ATCC 64428]